MIDIDDFKLHNDTYVSIAGDCCLFTIAKVIVKYVLSRGGKAGRYGGEEFLALFADTEEYLVIQIAIELVCAVKEKNIAFMVSGDCPVVTVSAGVYFEKNRLLFFADTALYKAKKQGRWFSTIGLVEFYGLFRLISRPT